VSTRSRVFFLHNYSKRTSTVHCLLVLILTPVPCLAISLLLEAIPLRAPSDGVDKSFLFWVRAYGIAYVVVFSMLQECCYLVPRIPFSNVSILVAAAICALGTVSSSYGMALTIGFPVPFMMITGSPALMILQSAAMVIMWGRYLARNQDARQAFTNYFNLTGMQIATIWVYPAYAFVFNRLSAGRQVAAMAMLPVIKLTIKNIFARLVGDKNDLRPCVVVLNADLFHTLFLSWCMNSATSKVAVVSMVLVDVVESMLALHDMKYMLAHIKGAKEHDSTPLVLLDAAVALATTAQVQVGPHQAKPLIGGPTVQVGQILRLHGRSWRRVHPVPGHSIQPRPYAFGCSNLLKKKPSVVTIASTDAEPQSITAAKTAQQASRLSDVSADNPQVRQFLRLSLQLLFFTEVVLLMEFVEIMIPLVYSKFGTVCTAMSPRF